MSDNIGDIFSVKKREYDEKRDAERAMNRLQRRRNRRCFWTHPFGHRWQSTEGSFAYIATCIACGKTKWID